VLVGDNNLTIFTGNQWQRAEKKGAVDHPEERGGGNKVFRKSLEEREGY